MSGDSVALDTNQAIAVLNNADDAAAWITGFRAIYLPVPVVGELLFGALNSRRPEENRVIVERLVKRCQSLSPTLSTAGTYAQVRCELKRRGRPIPENDVWIAAICIEHRVPLATSDAHFSDIDELDLISR